MNRETIIEEIDRLTNVGEPLLTMFPHQYPDSYDLALPDGISHDMAWYAEQVSYCSVYSKSALWWRSSTAPTLKKVLSKTKAGLDGWRVIGVLK